MVTLSAEDTVPEEEITSRSKSTSTSTIKISRWSGPRARFAAQVLGRPYFASGMKHTVANCLMGEAGRDRDASSREAGD